MGTASLHLFGFPAMMQVVANYNAYSMGTVANPYLDDELIEEMKSHLPEGVPSVFISSVSGLNIPRLKDMLWEALQP